MALPKAFQLLGVLPATAILLAVGGLTAFTLTALARAAERTGKTTYPSVVGAACGRPAKMLLIFCLIVGARPAPLAFLSIVWSL